MWWLISPNSPSDSPCWWAVEHLGHAAFYLRSLMPGDFGPHGRGPLPRHTYDLFGNQVDEYQYPVPCFSCKANPDPLTLVPIERKTGLRGRELFLAKYVFGAEPWPRATNQALCWNCCNPEEPPTHYIGFRKLCSPCYRHMLREQKHEDRR